MSEITSGLLTDLYQLTMAYGYWKTGKAQQHAVFHHTFRREPFGSGYAISCGLAQAIEWMKGWHFSSEDAEYLANLRGVDGKPLFASEFIEYLRELRLSCDIDAIPEGTVVFAREPLVRVRGPLLQCQLFETALLNIINFQTLIATKASRTYAATDGEPVLEFGLRRAQGVNGGVTASRAAYIGGCAATSNVLAGRLYDIPVRGTHAHSWVMSFDNEMQSFRAYADALPNNVVLLVDTYDTLSGVSKAIEIGNHLRETGHELSGIRLDSGDLNQLSQQARKMLDAAGFTKADIVASNDLDEYRITELKQKGAQINVWGVGTRLATAHDQPALGGVYKLGALLDSDGNWQYKMKLSEQAIKISDPGILQVRRFAKDGQMLADAIYDEPTGVPATTTIASGQGAFDVPVDADGVDLLVPVFRDGRQVYDAPSPLEARQRTLKSLASLPAKHRKLSDSPRYLVGLEQSLHRRKLQLMTLLHEEQ